jgi:RHS repeat-associated protein
LIRILNIQAHPFYRYGFNGMERDDEVKGKGNQYNYGDRSYDPRRGQWWALDKAQKLYPDISPYAFALNTPIQAKDPNGKLVILVNGMHAGDGGRSEYWNGFDKKAMKRLGDYKAMYFDGAMGGLSNTASHAAVGGSLGGMRAGIWGAVGGAAFNVFMNSNVNHEVRVAAGYAMGVENAETIFANLKPGESIKIITPASASLMKCNSC